MSSNDHGQDSKAQPLAMGSVVGRRQALTFLTMASTAAMLSACGGNGDNTPTPTPTPGPTPAPTPGPTPTPTPTCSVAKAEVAGPFPADGSNVAAPTAPTSNVLANTGVTRSDVRASFITSTATTPGVPVQITLRLVNTNAACAGLVGYAVYIWSANAQGAYSLYDVPAESWLRGVGVTAGTGETAGTVTFTTIIPGVETGRFPHFHIEVFATAASATSGAQAILTTQLIVPQTVAAATYTDPTNYAGQATKLATVTLATDPVFGDNTTAENALLTPSFNGGVGSGFTAGLTIGLAR